MKGVEGLQAASASRNLRMISKGDPETVPNIRKFSTYAGTTAGGAVYQTVAGLTHGAKHKLEGRSS